MLFCMTPEQRTEGLLREVRAEMGRQGVNMTRLSESTGISQPALSRKLRGESPLLITEALRIADVLHVTIPTLLGRVDDMAAT